MMSDWESKWRNLIGNAAQAGNLCRLTLGEYIHIAIESGLTSPDQIGCTLDSYQMARYGDTGDYEVGNCRFITMRENLAEKKINGGVQAQADKIRGRTKYDTDYLKRMSESQKGKVNKGSLAAAKIKKGTTIYNNPSVAKQADKLSKFYSLVSPDSVVHEGKNLSEFCRQHNLNQGCMSNVLTGRKKHHKGWTGEYIYE
jgi:hypothetical protein